MLDCVGCVDVDINEKNGIGAVVEMVQNSVYNLEVKRVWHDRHFGLYFSS